MNRYPLWKNLLVVGLIFLALLYTIPNFYGEVPAVQVSTNKNTLKIDTLISSKIETALSEAGLAAQSIHLETNQGGGTLRVKFKDTDTQIRAKDLIEKTLNPDSKNAQYIVALSLVPGSPDWLTSIRALPMYLGLDLRGGVHFLLQVDLEGAISKRLDRLSADIRLNLKSQQIRHGGVNKTGSQIEVKFRDSNSRDLALNELKSSVKELNFEKVDGTDEFKIVAKMSDTAIEATKKQAVEQNMNTLHKRINELAIAEPVIQKQGTDRIIVQLPGVQDTAKAKDILGRTATLEIRMVDAADISAEPIPDSDGRTLMVKRQVILTGDNLTDAQAGIEQQTSQPAVFLNLDPTGSLIFRETTRDNIGKQMAILLIEKGKAEVVTAPVIRSEIDGGRVQISGSMDLNEAKDTALLLRAGSLAAPMEIIEERVVGPSLGAENINRGLKSTVYGFIAIAIFMLIYYAMFGAFSVIALSVNVLCLFALLSLLQATLTLPGIAAIALALGMAIDANVLINERVREELRAGANANTAIHKGYEHAWATILDSNVTTLIAGLALLIFGSGPIKGFAVVHCLGILTSMFSAVIVSRALANAWYGYRKRLTKISIGEVWKG